MGRDMGPILEKISRLEASNQKLAMFAKAVINVAFEGGNLDGGEIQEWGVKHGLLNEEKYVPEKHGEDFLEIMDPGDVIYMHSDVLRDSAIVSTESAQA